MKLLETCAVALGCSAAGLFFAAAWHPGMTWPGVVVAGLALLAVGAFSWLEDRALSRRAVIFDEWEDRLAALEAKEEKTRAEVDTLTRERALNRM